MGLRERGVRSRRGGDGEVVVRVGVYVLWGLIGVEDREEKGDVCGGRLERREVEAPLTESVRK